MALSPTPLKPEPAKALKAKRYISVHWNCPGPNQAAALIKDSQLQCRMQTLRWGGGGWAPQAPPLEAPVDYTLEINEKFNQQDEECFDMVQG